jgi:hypothetical protein
MRWRSVTGGNSSRRGHLFSFVFHRFTYGFFCFFFATEYVDVGTEKVLESPHVSEGPGRIANSPVPSIYVDDRGEIHRFRVGGTRINMLFSKKDVMRSGYLHNHKTFTFVVKGNVELWLLEQEGTTKTVYGAGSFFQVSRSRD